MALPSPLAPELVELIAARFALLAEPMRIRILDQLREQELTGTELAQRLETSQQNISKHLGVLRTAEMVARRKQGNRSIYVVSDPDVLALCELVCGGIERRLDARRELIGEADAR